MSFCPVSINSQAFRHNQIRIGLELAHNSTDFKITKI